GVAFGEPEHVGRQLPDVPVVVHRLLRPIIRSQLSERVGEAAVLGLRQLHPLSMTDRRDVLHAHCRVSHFRLPFLFTCSKNMSTTSSTSRTQRSPPGSLAICWNESPEINPVQRSKYSVPTPARAMRALLSSTRRTATS